MPVRRIRPSPNEEQYLLAAEKERRRRIRLQQVRIQEKEFAANTRVKACIETERQRDAIRIRRQQQLEGDRLKTQHALKEARRLVEAQKGSTAHDMAYKLRHEQEVSAAPKQSREATQRRKAVERYDIARRNEMEKREHVYRERHELSLQRAKAIETSKEALARVKKRRSLAKSSSSNTNSTSSCTNSNVIGTRGFASTHYHLTAVAVRAPSSSSMGHKRSRDDAMVMAEVEQARAEREAEEKVALRTSQRTRALMRYQKAQNKAKLEQDNDELHDVLARVEATERQRKQAEFIKHNLHLRTAPRHKVRAFSSGLALSHTAAADRSEAAIERAIENTFLTGEMGDPPLQLVSSDPSNVDKAAPSKYDDNDDINTCTEYEQLKSSAAMDQFFATPTPEDVTSLNLLHDQHVNHMGPYRFVARTEVQQEQLQHQNFRQRNAPLVSSISPATRRQVRISCGDENSSVKSPHNVQQDISTRMASVTEDILEHHSVRSRLEQALAQAPVRVAPTTSAPDEYVEVRPSERLVVNNESHNSHYSETSPKPTRVKVMSSSNETVSDCNGELIEPEASESSEYQRDDHTIDDIIARINSLRSHVHDKETTDPRLLHPPPEFGKFGMTVNSKVDCNTAHNVSVFTNPEPDVPSNERIDMPTVSSICDSTQDETMITGTQDHFSKQLDLSLLDSWEEPQAIRKYPDSVEFDINISTTTDLSNYDGKDKEVKGVRNVSRNVGQEENLHNINGAGHLQQIFHERMAEFVRKSQRRVANIRNASTRYESTDTELNNPDIASTSGNAFKGDVGVATRKSYRTIWSCDMLPEVRKRKEEEQRKTEISMNKERVKRYNEYLLERMRAKNIRKQS